MTPSLAADGGSPQHGGPLLLALIAVEGHSGYLVGEGREGLISVPGGGKGSKLKGTERTVRRKWGAQTWG